MAVPALAPPEGYAGPKRSLVLAGGGMRVAYQAGVIRALEEAGLRFGHADGTSGGIMNLAMLLTGQPGEEMCARWRTLDPKGFVSMFPIRRYLRSPRWPAFGDARGVEAKVFPHLGVDAAAVRAAEGMVGTFNVCNYSRKVNEVIEHRDIERELLVAGISLPMLMPGVRHRGSTYIDSVWIRDANVLEAVRRGSDEVWVVWCIGNVSRYLDGSFRQYVHMIEMSANGSLFEDFDRVREINAGRERPVRLHVIRPELPIPLDPDYFLGRVDAATLIGMGYSDACRYLDALDPGGLPWTPDATHMAEPEPGVTFRLTLAGCRDGARGPGTLALHCAARLRDVRSIADPTVRFDLNGDVSGPGFGEHAPIRSGTLEVDQPGGGVRLHVSSAAWSVAATLDRSSRPPSLAALVFEGPEATGPAIGSATMPLGRDVLAQLLASLHATDTGPVAAKLRADAATARLLMGAVRGSPATSGPGARPPRTRAGSAS